MVGMLTVRMADNTLEGLAISYFLNKSIMRSKVQISGTGFTISHGNAKADVRVHAAAMRKPVIRDYFVL